MNMQSFNHKPILKTRRLLLQTYVLSLLITILILTPLTGQESESTHTSSHEFQLFFIPSFSDGQSEFVTDNEMTFNTGFGLGYQHNDPASSWYLSYVLSYDRMGTKRNNLPFIGSEVVDDDGNINENNISTYSATTVYDYIGLSADFNYKLIETGGFELAAALGIKIKYLLDITTESEFPTGTETTTVAVDDNAANSEMNLMFTRPSGTISLVGAYIFAHHWKATAITGFDYEFHTFNTIPAFYKIPLRIGIGYLF